MQGWSSDVAWYKMVGLWTSTSGTYHMWGRCLPYVSPCPTVFSRKPRSGEPGGCLSRYAPIRPGGFRLARSDLCSFADVIESLPVMFQLVLLLLGCGLSRYLWTIRRGRWGHCCHNAPRGHVICLLRSHYRCPYQTSPSIPARTTIGYVTHGHPLLLVPCDHFLHPSPPLGTFGEFSGVFPSEFVPCWRSFSHSGGGGGSRAWHRLLLS